jgi:hypothetical protein
MDQRATEIIDIGQSVLFYGGSIEYFHDTDLLVRAPSTKGPVGCVYRRRRRDHRPANGDFYSRAFRRVGHLSRRRVMPGQIRQAGKQLDRPRE